MRKTLLTLGLIVTGASSFAATTGSLQLQGVVSEVLAITVTAAAAASNLNLSATQADLTVGSVAEISNSNTGYKITISSSHNGSLLRSGGAETFSYSLKYDGSTVNLAGTSTTPASAKNVGTAGAYSDSSDVEISYTGIPAANMVAGTYQDTLTFEIVAN